MKIEFKKQCLNCAGTGVYVGMAEREGAAVVCNPCEGTGGQYVKIEYQEFKGRKRRGDITRVHEYNPGICIDDNPKYGGLEYEAWLRCGVFAPGTENRQGVCPAWWHHKTASWCNIKLGDIYSSCSEFKNKAECWGHWDKEEIK